MKALRALVALTPALALGCCPPAVTEAAAEEPTVAARPVFSLTGAPLPAVELSAGFRATQEKLLAEALESWREDPGDAQTWIWVGRRMAYLGRYHEAIEHYTRAIERFPDEPRLYRHRGHRHLTTRNLEAAIEDLSRAERLVAGGPDRIEPDGLPNERGVPTSTLKSNIWYHLGLARYLSGDFEEALGAYQRCYAVSANPDMLTATSYWLYLTLRRLGRGDEASEVLTAVEPGLEIIENHDYHRLLLSYQRLTDAHRMWEEASADRSAVSFSTVAYGLGAYHLIEGRDERARTFFERALESPAWAAFGHLAAEAELARMDGPAAEPAETSKGAPR